MFDPFPRDHKAGLTAVVDALVTGILAVRPPIAGLVKGNAAVSVPAHKVVVCAHFCHGLV